MNNGRNTMKKVIVFTMSFMSTCVLFAGITVTPVRVEIPLAKGMACDGKYTVRNDYDVPIKVDISSRDWFVLPENRDIKVDQWLKLSPLELSLKPGESGDIHFLVTLSTKPVGSMVAMVSFVPVLEKDPGFNLMVSASMFVTVKGTEKTAWDFSGIKLSTYDGKLQAVTSVKNDGNVYLRPVGYATITAGKKEVAKLEFLEGRPVYPGMARDVLAKSDGVLTLKPGKYTALLQVECRGQMKEKSFKFKYKKSGEFEIIN